MSKQSIKDSAKLMDNDMKKIYKFIVSNMDSYDLERSDNDNWKFKFVCEECCASDCRCDYDCDSDCDSDQHERDESPESIYLNFCVFQKEKIKTLSKSEILELLVLMNLIQKGIGNMDKESMVVFNASGFCYDANGKLVIFNER